MVCDDHGRLVGVGRLHLRSPTEAQIRYMATEPTARGKGYGRLLLRELERIARLKEAHRIVLSARKPVIGFYEKMGYTVTGEGHTLFGVVEHVRMQKHLSGSGRT
jgi:ribosomal protein S18 acetylase RimI-like enzyme